MSAPTEPVPAAHEAQGRELASYEQREPQSTDDTAADTMNDAAFDAYRDLPLDEVQKIYDILFDRDYYAEIRGDGAREDSYIDSVCEHAEQLVISGRTAADILAAREAAPNPEEDRYDDDEQLNEDTDFDSSLGY